MQIDITSWALGDLQKHESSAASANLRPNGVMQFPQLTGSLNGCKGMANSAAILNWLQSHSDWVRPGIVLYGICPLKPSALAFDPVMTLTSKILTIQEIQMGESIGYASSWVCTKNTRMGVIAIGYGDGYPWHVKAGTCVLIHNVRYKLVGRVSMDYLTVDLTDVPMAKVGDPVIVWGKGLPVEEIALQAGTSAYELCCQLTQRVEYKYMDCV